MVSVVRAADYIYTIILLSMFMKRVNMSLRYVNEKSGCDNTQMQRLPERSVYTSVTGRLIY